MPKPKDPSFFQNVYDVVRLIPHGRITSYGTIARYLGLANSARMVGWAMNGAYSIHPSVPAHRVVNRNGLLTGKAHFKNETDMQKRLEAEGIEVVNDQICEFKTLHWDPSEELKI